MPGSFCMSKTLRQLEIEELQRQTELTTFYLHDLRTAFYTGTGTETDRIRRFLQTETGLSTPYFSELWRAYFIARGVTNRSSLNDMARDFFENVGFTEVVLGYTDRTTGGTASASGSVGGGEVASAAFDKVSNTKWNVNSATPWLQYQFADDATYAINAYRIMSANDSPDRDPLDWTLQGSNNGTDWTDLDERSGEDFPLRFQQRVFQFANTTAYEYYRLNITANNGDANTQLAELTLFTQDRESADVSYGGAALSGNQANSGGGDGSEKADKAFDKSNASKWNDAKVEATDFWLQYDFGELTPRKITEYAIITANDSTDRDPKAWTLQASNTGAFSGEQVTVDTITDGALPDDRGASTTFVCDAPPAQAYRYYRWVVSDLKNLAAANSIQIAELQLKGT
jgi:hypothetical protein